MRWIIETPHWRERFEISVSDPSKKVIMCASAGSDNSVSHTLHYWLDVGYARDLAKALLAAADEVERERT